MRCWRHCKADMRRLTACAMAAYLLNLADLGCTIYAVSRGGIELNPLMQSKPVMIVYKLIVVGALLWWLSRRPERAAKVGLRICTAVYTVLGVYHVIGLAYVMMT